MSNNDLVDISNMGFKETIKVTVDELAENIRRLFEKNNPTLDMIDEISGCENRLLTEIVEWADCEYNDVLGVAQMVYVLSQFTTIDDGNVLQLPIEDDFFKKRLDVMATEIVHYTSSYYRSTENHVEIGYMYEILHLVWEFESWCYGIKQGSNCESEPRKTLTTKPTTPSFYNMYTGN